MLLRKKTYREIIDGQQRLRAITEYIDNKFPVSKTHNEKYGGMFYKDLGEEIQEQILDYDLFVEIISEKDDTVIYDMFARLNTNNRVLNRQEIRNYIAHESMESKKRYTETCLGGGNFVEPYRYLMSFWGFFMSAFRGNRIFS